MGSKSTSSAAPTTSPLTSLNKDLPVISNAIIHYPSIAREEAGYELGRLLTRAGYEVTVTYTPGLEIVDFGFGGVTDDASWDRARQRGAQGTNTPVLALKVCPHGEGLPLPAYETEGAAGMDLRAAIGEDESISLLPGERRLIPSGISLAIPHGYEVQVRPRSGLALKHGISVVNTPGTVDCDYRGEIKIVLINHGQHAFSINRGDRIAQMVVAPVVQAIVNVVDELDATHRGENGYGSTGST